MNVATLPDERAISDPDGPCLSDERLQLDNKVFASSVRAVAGWLHEYGIRSGDVVAAMLPNRVELATLLFAAWRIGAVLTPLNPGLTAEEANSSYMLTLPSWRLWLSAVRIRSSGKSRSPSWPSDAGARLSPRN